MAAGDLPDATSTQYIAAANSVAMAFIAVLSPILGALADYTAAHKRLLGTFMGIGVSAVAAMFFIGRGDVWLQAASVAAEPVHWILFLGFWALLIGSAFYYRVR